MQRETLLAHLDQFLQPHLFKDYAPNGLQVEGKREIKRIVTAVSATQAVIDRAAQLRADALLVHHGWFWRGENPRIIQTKYRRLKALMAADMNLIAYHLPLDAHPEVGNNAQLALKLGARDIKQSGEGNFVWSGVIDPVDANHLAQQLTTLLHRPAQILGDSTKRIEKLAWCSGAAADFLDEAIAIGVDAYISGEAAERTTHLARESGVPFFVCGHHATERLGIQALGDWIEKQWAIECIFVDDDNPI